MADNTLFRRKPYEPTFLLNKVATKVNRNVSRLSRVWWVLRVSHVW